MSTDGIEFQQVGCVPVNLENKYDAADFVGTFID
jgi:hypothetical protein